MTLTDILVNTEGGPRVSLSLLHQAFGPHERARWYRLSVEIPHDEFGILPEFVEEFLSPVQLEMF
jgi:hypothetical protein